jgi:hypothetical protein
MAGRNSAIDTIFTLVVMSVTTIMCGCSTLAIPTPREIISKPFGTESVKIGMTVESIWGKPDHVGTVENKEKWASRREVWTYNARYGAIPVDAGYLSKTQKLYFDGENLTEMNG